MASPAKRRKLNADAKSSSTSSRGLEFFFSKQQKKDLSEPSTVSSEQPAQDDKSSLSDEQLARKLQAEWDAEAGNSASVLANSELPQTTATAPEPATKAASAQTSLSGVIGSQLPSAVTEEKSSASTVQNKSTLSLQSAGNTEDTISSEIPFDESPLTFDPQKYVPDLQERWASEGGNASYALLTRCFVLVNSTQSRIKIVDTLVNLIRIIIEGDPNSLLPTVSTLRLL